MVERATDLVIEKMIARRENLGLSQSALAKLVGNTQSAISDVETGTVSPNLRTLRKIVAALDLKIDLAELTDVDRDVRHLKSLTPDELEKELLVREWYAHPNDLAGGGYCVMPIDAPPSSGCFPIADFMSEAWATSIVKLHNDSIEHPACASSSDGRELSCIERWPECWNGGYDPRCCRFPKSCSC